MKLIPRNNKLYHLKTPAKSAVHDKALELNGGSLMDKHIMPYPKITEQVVPRVVPEKQTRILPKKLVSI